MHATSFAKSGKEEWVEASGYNVDFQNFLAQCRNAIPPSNAHRIKISIADGSKSEMCSCGWFGCGIFHTLKWWWVKTSIYKYTYIYINRICAVQWYSFPEDPLGNCGNKLFLPGCQKLVTKQKTANWPQSAIWKIRKKIFVKLLHSSSLLILEPEQSNDQVGVSHRNVVWFFCSSGKCLQQGPRMEHELLDGEFGLSKSIWQSGTCCTRSCA